VFGENLDVRAGLVALKLLSIRMSPFSSFYDKAFNKNLICPQGIIYNPYPEGCGGSVILKNKISRPFNYFE
jgi:hypothetical protein